MKMGLPLLWFVRDDLNGDTFPMQMDMMQQQKQIGLPHKKDERDRDTDKGSEWSQRKWGIRKVVL